MQRGEQLRVGISPHLVVLLNPPARRLAQDRIRIALENRHHAGRSNRHRRAIAAAGLDRHFLLQALELSSEGLELCSLALRLLLAKVGGQPALPVQRALVHFKTPVRKRHALPERVSTIQSIDRLEKPRRGGVKPRFSPSNRCIFRINSRIGRVFRP